MFAKLAIRDLVIVMFCLACWALEMQLRGTGGFLHVLAALAAGLTTVIVGYCGHEWGHLTGAVIAGGRVYAPNNLSALFLFHFDTRLNSPKQFLSMSVGGFVASIAFFIFLLAVLPLNTLAAIVAVAISIIGLIATAITELPMAWRVGHGAALPTGPVYEPISAPVKS
jgi:peptidoglycan biosynthesis protein MviN/MurJ (putative lipid II flippase)